MRAARAVVGNSAKSARKANFPRLAGLAPSFIVKQLDLLRDAGSSFVSVIATARLAGPHPGIMTAQRTRCSGKCHPDPDALDPRQEPRVSAEDQKLADGALWPIDPNQGRARGSSIGLPEIWSS